MIPDVVKDLGSHQFFWHKPRIFTFFSEALLLKLKKKNQMLPIATKPKSQKNNGLDSTRECPISFKMAKIIYFNGIEIPLFKMATK